jgi:AAA15 family ATPase/GTPase
MRLIRIEIENFKGIGERQIVEMRPITLLFGPNSAGKSTILQALHYLREVLERGNVDPDVTIAGARHARKIHQIWPGISHPDNLSPLNSPPDSPIRLAKAETHAR